MFFSSALWSQRPCSSPEYRQFDFWLGEWEAFSTNGQKAGDSGQRGAYDWPCQFVEGFLDEHRMIHARFFPQQMKVAAEQINVVGD